MEHGSYKEDNGCTGNKVVVVVVVAFWIMTILFLCQLEEINDHEPRKEEIQMT